MNNMKNRKGFTLIELLAVIIILGILMIIAIPSVTKYITDSRKNTYISTAKEIIGGARTFVNEGNYKMYDTDTTYYIPAKMIHTETAFRSPYGDFTEAYIGVTYNGLTFKYYWISNDITGTGIDKVVSNNKLEVELIKADIKDSDINNSIHITGIGNRSKIMILQEDGTWIDVTEYPDEYVVEEGIYTNDYMCPGCKYLRSSSSLKIGNTLTQTAYKSYEQLPDYKTKPFLGVKTDNNNKITMFAVCFITDGNLGCLRNDYILYDDGYNYFTYVLMDMYGAKEHWILYDTYQEMTKTCTSLWYRNYDRPGGTQLNEGNLYICKNADGSVVEYLENEGVYYYTGPGYTGYRCLIYDHGMWARCY